jgi:hypothetical protein
LKLLIFSLICFFYTTGFAQQWAVTYSNPLFTDNFGEDKAYSVAAGDSSVFVTGFSLGLYGNDILTIKYNLNGDTLWTARYNGTGNNDDRPSAITVDAANNAYVTGYVTGINTGTDIITIRYFSNGDSAWAVIFDGAGHGNDRGLSICTDAANNVYVGGFATDSAGDCNFIVIKYSYDGHQHWKYEYDGTGNEDDIAYAIALGGDNNIVATGSTMTGQDSATQDIITVKINSESSALIWKKIYGGQENLGDKAYAITVEQLDNVIITGYTTRAPGNRDIITMKYTSEGDSVWTRTFNGLGNSLDEGTSIAVTGSSVFVAGWTRAGTLEGTEDYVVLSYRNDSTGQQIWQKTYNGPGNNSDIAYSLAVSGTNNAVYVTGSSRTGITAATDDMLTLKYDINSGNELDTSRYNGQNNDEDAAYDIAVDTIGNVYVTGYTVTGGVLDNPSPGASDYLTLKYLNGNLISAEKNSNNVPLDYLLYQNYPNPFNPVTNIKFEAPKAGHVKLVLYDILGREIIGLFDSYVQPGVHSIIFNGSSLSSGVYFYELRTDDFRDVRKMVLIK